MAIETHLDLPADVIEAIRANRKIDAIKLLRQHRGLGLKEAKHAVEAYARENPESNLPPMPQSESGLGRIILLAIALGALYAAFQYFG